MRIDVISLLVVPVTKVSDTDLLEFALSLVNDKVMVRSESPMLKEPCFVMAGWNNYSIMFHDSDWMTEELCNLAALYGILHKVSISYEIWVLL